MVGKASSPGMGTVHAGPSWPEGLMATSGDALGLREAGPVQVGRCGLVV